MEQAEGWSQRITADVGRRVAYYRSRLKGSDGRKLTTQGLADRTREVGYPLDRSVIAKLERGHRQTITIPDLLVLAKALEVSAVQLIYPLGSVPEVEVLPGHMINTEDAMLWFTGWHDPFRDEASERIGHSRRGGPSPDGLHEWYETPYSDAAYPIHEYAEHRKLLRDHEDAVKAAVRGLGAEPRPEELRDEVSRLRKTTETVLQNVRTEMRRRGLAVLPDLPPGLEHLR